MNPFRNNRLSRRSVIGALAAAATFVFVRLAGWRPAEVETTTTARFWRRLPGPR
ncbi:MAG: hypothetical protein PVH29_07875 [Candidatus Zixiibacteriota bacterium]|jgi:hypothetical protein